VKTNVLLIETDQWNARALGALGHPDARTPNLDRLAREGTLFANHYCNHPLCLPSRVSLLSGQYPGTHKQYGFSGLLDRRTPMLQVVFKEGGWRTGASGKFHVHSIPPEQWTFDYAAPTLLNEIDMARPAGNHYMGYCDARGVPCPNDQQHCGNPWGRKKPVSSHATGEMFWMHQESVRSDVPLEHSLEVYTVDRCLEFLRGVDGSRPFFYWLTFDRPHHPTTLPEPWFSRVDPDRVHLDALPTAEQLAALPPSVFQDYARHCSRLNLGEKAFRFIVATYMTLLEFMDAEIGRVLEHLRQAGLDERTTIVFTADHGDEAGQRGLYEKFLGVSSQELCRAPLIIRPAPVLSRGGRTAGRRVEEPVESIDVFPTLCALAGLAAPPAVEGADLSRTVLEGGALDRRRPVFIEEIQSRSVVRDEWKFVYDILPDERQLYDLGRDPWCFENLYGRPEHRDRRMEMKRLLVAFLMQRLHGPYTEADVAHVRRALDPACPETGLHISGMAETNNHRAACTVRDPSFELFVPFYDGEPMLLFPRRERGGERHGYRKRDEAVADPDRAEGLLDQALDRAFAGMHGLSNTRHWPKCEYARPSPEAARELVARWKAGHAATGGALPGSEAKREPGRRSVTRPRENA